MFQLSDPLDYIVYHPEVVGSVRQFVKKYNHDIKVYISLRWEVVINSEHDSLVVPEEHWIPDYTC